MFEQARAGYRISILLTAVMLLSGFVSSARAGDRFVTIGAGSDPGLYYHAAAAICRLVNARREEHGIRCYVRGSGGSVYNMHALRRSEMDFGIVQADVQRLAVEGREMFGMRGPFVDLRSLFLLHEEPFTVAARAEAGITRFSDLKGKRVNVGNPGSGHRGTLAFVLAAMGWTTADFELATELKLSEQSDALCRGEIDAMIFVAGHPNESLQKAAALCAVNLVDVSGPEIDRLVAQRRSYDAAWIPGGLYRGVDTDTRTFSVRAVFVTTAAVPEEVVYAVMKSVFADLPELTKAHPGLKGIEAVRMRRESVAAPLHTGAKRYYEERFR